MSGYVCTVAGGKGGVGKTTTVVNTAAVLESEGYDVAVVDADLGMANLGEMIGLEHDRSIHEVLAGDSTVSETLTTTDDGVTVIPGEQRIEAFAEADPANLSTVIKTLRNAYDVVIVDTGAGLSHETTVPLGLADGIVLVTTADDVAINDTTKTGQLADRVDGSVSGALLTRVTEETDVGAIGERLGFPLLGAIPVDFEATKDEPLVLNSPDSPAATAYEQVTGLLGAIFFDGADPADLEPVYAEAWFEDGGADDESESDDSGGFGLSSLRNR